MSISADHRNAAGFRAPFLIVNPKAYVYGAEALELATMVDELAARYGIDVIYTAQQLYIRMIADACPHLTVTAQHMDAITPGRGMGYILPEALAAAGAKAVILNHAEHPVSLAALDATMQRAREVGLMTIVCADSYAQCVAIAHLGPDVMICEPTANIGTGDMVSEEYVDESLKLVRAVDPEILIIEAAGVNDAEDIKRVIEQGADGSGGTSIIVNAPDRRATVDQMLSVLSAHAGKQAA